mgnify:CR=1 FL=1
MDDVLPNTNIRYRIDSSECAGGAAVEKAVQQAILPQDGYGKVVAVVGATCSGASMAAANLLEIFKKPLISGSSTNPTLSDSDKYPYFMRTVPSDLAQGEGLGHLAGYLNATRMGVLSGDGAYPMGIAKEFRTSALVKNGITVPTTAFETITKQTNVDGGDGKEYVNADLTMVCKLESLHNEGMRHFLFSTHDPDVHYIATASILTGFLKGDEYMYYAVDSWATTNFAYLEGGTHVRGWWYNSENLGGYWAIQGDPEWGGLSSSGVPGKLVPLEHVGSNLQSVSLGGGCKPISGTVDGENIVLDGRSGRVTETTPEPAARSPGATAAFGNRFPRRPWPIYRTGEQDPWGSLPFLKVPISRRSLKTSGNPNHQSTVTIRGTSTPATSRVTATPWVGPTPTATVTRCTPTGRAILMRPSLSPLPWMLLSRKAAMSTTENSCTRRCLTLLSKVCLGL